MFSITIPAPDPDGICLEDVSRPPTIQKYENVDGLEIQKIKDYASKEGEERCCILERERRPGSIVNFTISIISEICRKIVQKDFELD